MSEALATAPHSAEPRLSPQQEAHLRGWRWEMRIGGKRLTKAVSASVSYSAEGAASVEMETTMDLPLASRAPIEVVCGYLPNPRSHLIFEGTVGSVIRDPFTRTTHLTAYGVQGAMARQYFDQPRDFAGYTLPQFFGEIQGLLYDYRAVIETRRGFDVVLEDADYGGEATLLEAAQAVTQPTGHVLYDRPSFDLLVMPRPEPVIGATPTFEYGPRDFQAGTLTINPAEGENSGSGGSAASGGVAGGPYAKVVAFRREDVEVSEGSEGQTETREVVRAEAGVSNPGPSYPRPNEIYWIADFPGSQSAAERVVRQTAAALSIGSFAGSAQGVYANPGLIPPRPIRVKRREEAVMASYSSRVTDALIDLVSGKMDFSFAALKEAEVEVRRARPPGERARRSQHLITYTAPKYGRGPDGRVYFEPPASPETPWYGFDEEGLWLAPQYATGRFRENIGYEEDGRIWLSP